MLSRHVITEIDKAAAVAGYHPKTAAAAPSPAQPSWLASVGTVVSTLLPSIIKVLQALQSLQSAPTPAQFFAKGHELFGE